MTDIKLFRYEKNGALELPGKSALIEKDLQNLLEAELETFLGIRFLATEFSTGKNHKGRIDTLGLDENFCPVIIEYKRHLNENVMNQGLFYLDWLLDHKSDFILLVMEKLGKEASDKIEWSGTRLICIASDFTRYDQHAVFQIRRNIELIRYKLFGNDLLLLELVNAYSGDESPSQSKIGSHRDKKPYIYSPQIEAAPIELQQLYEKVKSFILAQGDDVQEKRLKLYTAFKRIRNFLCLIFLPKQDPQIKLWLKLNPDTVILENGFSRDVRNVGHWGTGDLEIIIRDQHDFEKARLLIERSYQEN